MAARWTPKQREAALADLRAGQTVPAVAEAHGVPIGTLRRWKRDDRGDVVDMRGQKVDADPLQDEIDALLDDDPEAAIVAQVKQLVTEKARAAHLGQFGAAAAMQKQIADLRQELQTRRSERPQVDPLDLPEAEVIRRLRQMAHRWPLVYLEQVVTVYCERVDARVVDAAAGGR